MTKTAHALPLERPLAMPFHIGDWTVDPASGEISRGATLVRLEDRTLRLLLCLAEHAGQVLSMDELLQQVWPDVVVSPDSIYQAITSLRRQLGDDSKQPSYIATVPRRGYRLIARVSALADEPVRPAPARTRKKLLLLIALVAGIAAIAMLVLGSTPAARPHAVAVLPFLDLTDDMNEEPFADGMTEELIGKLSKVPGLQVSPPASSFYFKEKRVTVAEVAKALNVAFVLDGSVRKSGSNLRVAARVTRASDGFVVWTDTYDRAWSDKLKIQEDIAGEVSKALASSLTASARPAH